MQVLIALLTILLSIFGYIIYLSLKSNNYWKKKGIPHVKPYLFVGNMLDAVLGRLPQGQIERKICNEFPDEPFVGFYSFTRPVLMVKDPIYVEKILVRDFASFTDRGGETSDLSPLQTNLFNLTGNKWRAIRNKLSPIFTSGKLKNMFNNMTDIGTDLNKAIENSNLECVDMHDITGRFAMDTIGLYGFGISPKSLENPDTEFAVKGKNIFKMTTLIDYLKFIFLIVCPYLAQKLKLSIVKDETINFFVGIIRNTLNERVKHKMQRNDFIDLMLQLKNKGSIEIKSKDSSDDYLIMEEDQLITEKFDVTDDLLIGQAFAFLIAGFEGFASSLTFTLYELSKNQEIQDKLREEILSKINEHGILNYDTIKNMTYLDMCLKESLRMHNPPQIIFRVCSKDYTFPNGYFVKKGDHINIPLDYIHMDPKNFPNPDKFDPERFNPDISQQACSYLPFGEGPRMCIAMRFAILQVKFGLIKTIMNFKIKLNSKTQEPIELDPKSFVAIPKNPIYFNLTQFHK